MKFKLPYNRTYKTIEVEDKRIKGVLVSKTEKYTPSFSQTDLVKNSLLNPIGSKPLSILAKDKKRVVIISSDHTRPVPSAITMPLLLEEIRKYNDNVEIIILVATGMHRASTKDELIDKYGMKIVVNEKIIVHNAYDDSNMAFFGTLPSGGELWLNKLINEADLLVSEGFIEPHFFAGYSGGRKSVLPGIASKKTVLWNHNSRFIGSKYAKSGCLENNPIHEDMLYAVEKANLVFILNVVINDDKHIIESFAGDPLLAHAKGVEFVSDLASVKKVSSDIVITTNGGYPLDQNIYQTVKGMTSAEICVNNGGVIIMISSCIDGTGGDYFYKLLADEKNAIMAYKNLSDVPLENTEFDQWEAQILARILCKAKVILVSEVERKIVENMHIIYASDIKQALLLADELTNKGSICIIPNGIGVIIGE